MSEGLESLGEDAAQGGIGLGDVAGPVNSDVGVARGVGVAADVIHGHHDTRVILTLQGRHREELEGVYL